MREHAAPPSSARGRRERPSPGTDAAGRVAGARLQHLHRSIGNAAVSELLRGATDDGGLRIDRPGSSAEKEADRAGEDAARASGARTDVGADRRLTAEARRLHESRLGRDLSDVRVHTDREAAVAAQALGARAWTLGRDVFFGGGRFAPGTRDGERLIGHELAHVVQQRREGPPRVQRDEECPSIFTLGGVPGILDCELEDLDRDDDTSCCSSTTRDLVPGLYTAAREHVDRALQRLRRGANMDGALRRHFGGGGLWQRAEIQRRLEVVRAELDEESTHVVRCRIARSVEPGPGECHVSWPADLDNRLFCRYNVAASARIGGNVVTLCIDIEGRPAGGWTTLLHEIVHLSGVADLPAHEAGSTERQATDAQIARGEYEMYEGGDRYPNPTPYALRNADSFAAFVRDVGSASWSEESNPAAYLPTVEAGPVVSLEDAPRPGVGGRLLWTPLGGNFQMIAGVGGVWLPRIEDRELASPPEPTDLRAYVGAELGLRWIVGGDDLQFVLDIAGGGGPYVTVDEDVDAAFMGRLGLGLRYGGPQASFGVSAEVMRLLHVDNTGVIGDEASDWLGGLVFRGSWGGSSTTPR